ncbi:ShlB/FhaC/HecB family hemolysin secretion/activation protein [Candidatus Pelagibacter sp. HIMB1709]|uniref:ShlB/FhaC/HecB family hemolysin secretion/activation protein n=1 Tax=Candidatus Pelagibacter sp. HIMB1709 TaxID=3413367 RepID=UPI003F8709D8
MLKKIFNVFLIIILINTTFSVISVIAVAPSPGDLLRNKENYEKNQKIPKKIPDILLKKEKITDTLEGDQKILVEKFQFIGELDFVPIETLQNLIKEFNGKELNFGEIQSVVNTVNRYFQNQGLLVARAYLPKQEVKDNTILISIYEGKLDSDQPYRILSQGLKLKEDKIFGYLDKALERGLTYSSLERAILNLNDNPGVSTKASLEPGDETGETRIVLDIREQEFLTYNTSFNNHGSRYTGKNRATVNFTFNNPYLTGDKFDLILAKSDEDYKSIELKYNFPIGEDGWRLDTSYNYFDYKIGKELASSNILGDSETFKLNARYPYYRTSLESLFFDIGYTEKYLYSETAGSATSDKELKNFVFGAEWNKSDNFYGGGYTQIKPTITFGDLDLSKVASSLNSDSSGARTNGSFEKTTIDITRIQKINDNLNLHLFGTTQFASKNLDSSEKLSLGGPAGIRAYPVGEATGDEGFRYSIDAKYNVIAPKYFDNLTAIAFYDYGMVKQYTDLTNLSVSNNTYSLEGYGIGFEATKGENISVKASLAKAIGGNPGASNGKNTDGLADDEQLFISISAKF